MNLTKITYHASGSRSVNRSDAALLSLLPYGVGQKAALAMYFSSTRNGNRAVKTLVERGLLEEHQLQTAQGSSQNYLMLTLAGLEHLEQKYNYYYPWLTDAVELLREEDTVSFVRGLSSGTVRSLLTAHGCNVAFNVANIDTFYDRLLYEAERALTTMSVHYYSTNAKETAFCSIFHAYQQCVEYTREEQGKPVFDAQCAPVQFYDSIELKVSANSPYQDTSKTALIQTNPFVERRERMAGQVGLLKTPNNLYIVYRSREEGQVWNSALVEQCHRSFIAEGMRLGLIHSAAQVPSQYPSVLLVGGRGEKVSAFRRVVEDPWDLRSRRDKQIGLGTSALHAIPLTKEGLSFLTEFTTEDRFVNYNEAWIDTLVNYCSDCVRPGPQGADYPLVYAGMPCYCCLDLDLHQINKAVEAGRCAVVCFDWQVKYVRAVAPEAVLAVVDFDNHTVIRWDEAG